MKIRGILFSADRISKNGKYYRQTLNFDSSYKLNCDLTFENMEVVAKSFTGITKYALLTKNKQYTTITYA